MTTTTTTLVKTARTLVSAGTSNTAGSTTRGTLDLRTAQGGLLTVKLTNGGTGPTVQCTARVLVAHNASSTPSAASAGSDWKTFVAVLAGSGTNASAVTEASMIVPKDVMHLEVEFTGNTGQTVTVEAYLSETTSASTS